MILPLFYTFALVKPVPAWVPEVVSRWGDLVDVTVLARDCGHENAFYYPGDDTVVLCTELFKDRDLAAGILNHELAHAFFDQHDLDFGGQEEFNADELGWMFSTSEESTAQAAWHLDKADAEDPRWLHGHPRDIERAWMYLCLDDGFMDPENASNECFVYTRSVRAKWTAILNLAQ